MRTLKLVLGDVFPCFLSILCTVSPHIHAILGFHAVSKRKRGKERLGEKARRQKGSGARKRDERLIKERLPQDHYPGEIKERANRYQRHVRELDATAVGVFLSR